jgi:hypothetical protein
MAAVDGPFKEREAADFEEVGGSFPSTLVLEMMEFIFQYKTKYLKPKQAASKISK